ncbi:MAG: hypothetical protein EBZ48_00145 [Proteobacteria bacterium]|nr:hypothetical protein [Pseudomonadota bacterium]
MSNTLLAPDQSLSTPLRARSAQALVSPAAETFAAFALEGAEGRGLAEAHRVLIISLLQKEFTRQQLAGVKPLSLAA